SRDEALAAGIAAGEEAASVAAPAGSRWRKPRSTNTIATTLPSATAAITAIHAPEPVRAGWGMGGAGMLPEENVSVPGVAGSGAAKPAGATANGGGAAASSGRAAILCGG